MRAMCPPCNASDGSLEHMDPRALSGNGALQEGHKEVPMKLYVVNSKIGPESAERTVVFRTFEDALVVFGKMVARWEEFLNEPMAYDLGMSCNKGYLPTTDTVVAWPVRSGSARDIKVSITCEHQFNYST